MTKASNDNDPGIDQPAKKLPCPICRADSCHEYRPFCSKRCADVDLGRWLGGSYFIPADPSSEEDDSLRDEYGSSQAEDM